MSSTVWRQRADPHSIYPMRLRRLDAETLRDRMLASSGALDRTLYGRPVRAVEDGRGQVAIEGSAPRRSLYAQVRRSLPIAFLHTFDAPVMKTLCRRRESSTASTQSLTLLNGPFVLQQAAALAERVKRETSGEDGDPDRQNEKISGVEALAVRKAWQFAYCREPQPEELQLANEFLTLQLETLQRLPDAVPKDRTAESQALTNLCQSLLGSNEFLYLE